MVDKKEQIYSVPMVVDVSFAEAKFGACCPDSRHTRNTAGIASCNIASLQKVSRPRNFDGKGEMEKIKRIGFSDDRGTVEDAVINVVERDPEPCLRAFVEDARSFGGRYISADLMKEQFPYISLARVGRARYNLPVHNASAVLASEQLRRVLTERAGSERDSVIFLTGVPGAGKTSSVLQHGFFPSDCHAIYEEHLSLPVKAIEKIQWALAAGYRPQIVVIHALPEYALINTLTRFSEVGRGASIQAIADIQANLPASLAGIYKRFRDNVALYVIDKRDREHTRVYHGWDYLRLLRSEGDYEQIKKRLVITLDNIAPDIDDAASRQAKGRTPLPFMLDGKVVGSSDDALSERKKNYGRGKMWNRGTAVLRAETDGLYHGPIVALDNQSALQLTQDGFIHHEYAALSDQSALQLGRFVSIRYVSKRVGFVREQEGVLRITTMETQKPLTEAEQAKRRFGFKKANHSLALEGMITTPEDLAEQEKVIRGELTYDEAVANVILKASGGR
jgi:hypothetical protein